MNNHLIQGYTYNIKDIFKEELSIERERELFFKAKNSHLKELFTLESKTTGEVKDTLRKLRSFLENPIVNNKTLELIGKGFSRGYSYNKASGDVLKNLKKNDCNNFNNVKTSLLIKMYEHRLQNLPLKETILVVDELNSFILLNIPSNVKGIIVKKEISKPFLKTLIDEKDIFVIVNNETFENDTFISFGKADEKVFSNKKDFKLSLNISSFNEVDKKTKEIIDEIGMFKTEYLFLGKGYVDKETQINIYKNMLEEMYPKKVKIRLFDFKNDKKPYFLKESKKYKFNLFGPLHHLYEEQLEALLYANEGLGNLEIIVPEIKKANEFKQVVEMIKTIHKNNKLKESLPKIGMMLGRKEAFEKLNSFKNTAFMIINTSELGKELLDFNEKDQTGYKDYTKNMIEIIKIVSSFCKKNNINYRITGSFIKNETHFNMLIQRQERMFSIPKSFLKTALEIINLNKTQ